MEAVSIDFDVSSDSDVSGRKEVSVLVDVLVLPPFEELAFHDAGVLLGRLEDGNGVISQVEGNDEASVDVFRHAGVELGSVSQDFLVVVHVLEEVSFGLFGKQLEHVTQRVHFVSEAVVGRNLNRPGLSGPWELNSAKFEVFLVLLLVEVLGELVHSLNSEHSPVSFNCTAGLDLVACQVIISNEVLSGLVHCEAGRQLSSFEEESEGVSSVISVMDFSNFYGVISQIVVDDIGHVIAPHEEAEDFAVVVEELLLGDHTATTEGFL